jgi:hypothetical protein
VDRPAGRRRLHLGHRGGAEPDVRGRRHGERPAARVYGRIPIGAARYDVTGDRAVLERWIEKSAI